MGNKTLFQGNTKIILAAIILVSVILRVLAATYIGSQVESLPGTNDQISYHNLALRILGGHGFSFGEPWWPYNEAGEPTAHWSYLYTFYLAAVYSIFGPNPLVARLIQAVLVGVLHPLLAYLIGRKVFSEKVGLISAGITAVYIYFIYYNATLMTESFYITAILASLYLAMQMVEEESTFKKPNTLIKYSVYLGLTLTAAILLRQLFLLFVPILFLWIWWTGRQKKVAHGLRPLWITSMVIVLLILPFTIYNYVRFNRFVLLNTNAGFAFYWGNHPIYGTSFVPILTDDMGSYGDLIPEDVKHLDEAAMDQALLKKSIENILEDPGRYVMLSISRIPPYFMFWPSSQSGTLSNISRVGSFGLFLPFMLYGLILSMLSLPKGWREWTADPKMLLLGFAFIYTLIHLLTWTLIRYRLPVDAVLVLFAGYGIQDLVHKVVAYRNKKHNLELNRQT